MERLISVWPGLNCIFYLSLVLSSIVFISGISCGVITRLHLGYYCVYGGGVWAGIAGFFAAIFGIQAVKYAKERGADLDGMPRRRLIVAHYVFGVISFVFDAGLVYLASDDYYYCRAFHLLHGEPMALVAAMVSMAMMVEALLMMICSAFSFILLFWAKNTSTPLLMV